MDLPKKSKKGQNISLLGQDSNQFSKLKGTIFSFVEDIHSKMISNLWQMYESFNVFMPKNYKVINDPYEIWTTYLTYEIEKYEKDRFSGEIQLFKLDNIIDPSIIAAFWKSRDIYEDLIQMPWRFRISENSLEIIKSSTIPFKISLLKKLIEFGLGYILENYNCQILRTGPCIGMVFFCFPFIEEDNDSYSSNIEWHGVAACLLERIPIIQDNKVIGYSYEQYIKLLSIIDNPDLARNIVDDFCEEIREDPDRWIEYSDWMGNFDNNPWRHATEKIYPLIIPQVFFNDEESNSIKFNAKLGRWVWNDVEILEKWEKNEKLKNNLVRLLSEENSCKDFVKLLKTLPNMPLKLTDEEIEVIKTPGNILTIGRSGTGKTICSLLRMFSAEILYRYKTLKNKKLKAEDIDSPQPLHFIFATASPVLANEAKIYYKKLKKLIKNGLRAKEKTTNIEEEKHDTVEKQTKNIEEIEEDIKTGPHSMKFLQNKDFPLFLTIRKLILMIDASLDRPFFSRDTNGRVTFSSSTFEWHNESFGTLEISKNYKKETEIISDSDEEEYNKYYEPQWDDTQKQIRNWWIDFKAFSENFYPSLTCEFSPFILWTEISAYIKGSSKAYLSRGFYLSQEDYIELDRKSLFLTEKEKVEIYRVFGLYEDWKKNVCGYDFQDIVNYIRCEIHYHGYKGVPIHYMMVDEVQDLTSATLNLLMEVTDQKIVFSGDSSEATSKDVGFRFCDLKSLFSESSLDSPTVIQLTKNFRSNNKILELANSVVAVIETLFPETIDKMGKEKSLKDGPYPIIINSGNHDDLLNALYANIETIPEASSILFGCNQVVIVRNQESKIKLPLFLKPALCLTIYEAKGLEFDDVILYNFFTDSEMPMKCWKALDYKAKIQDDPDYKPNSLEDLRNEIPKLTKNINKNKYSQLCTELKQLYVAITRTKERLIIYDDKPENSEKIRSYWQKIDQSSFKAPEEPQISLFQIFTKNSTKEEWMEQGHRLMSHQLYEQAAKCFRAAEEIFLESKALAYFKAKQASELMITAGEKRRRHAKNRNFKKECKEIEEKAKSEFISAGNEFLMLSEINDKDLMLKEAAMCFASAKENAKAADIYQSIGLISQAADTYLSGGFYEAAGDLYTEKLDYIRAIEAYRCCRKWDKLIHCIYKCRNINSDEEREEFCRKFLPSALEVLRPKFSLDKEKEYINKIEEEDKNAALYENGKIEEEKENSIVKIASEQPLSLIKDSQESFNLVENSPNNSLSLTKDNEILKVLQRIDPQDKRIQLFLLKLAGFR